MAMQPAGSVPLPSAQVVGNAFVEQYYHILHQSPEVVHKFYTDSSILSRPEPDGSMISVTTQQAINEKIQSMGYKNYKVEIKTADAQDSHQAGVVVLVTGCLTGTDNVRKKFTQMFFLAPQEKGYFVLNDVFRFVEESESSETVTATATATATAPTADIPSTEALITAPDPSLVLPGHSAAAPEDDDVENGPEVCDPSENEGSVLEEEVADGPQSKPTENETVTVTSGNPEEKKSYASIVKVSKATTGATVVYVPTGSARATPVKANNQRTRVPETASPERQASVPADVSAPESGDIHEEGYSIYIRNMPQNATVQQLEEIFKKFGPIKHDGIQVRSNKQASCFGFVEFESLESMQNAIKASPINIGSRQADVEEKRTNTRVGSSSSGRGGGGGGGGRYPTGRGGGWYRNESFRGGRGGNFGGRGYGRTDFRNQGEFSNRLRGVGGSGGGGGRSVETYQRVDQTASGRSNSQGGNKKNTTTTTTTTTAPA